MFHPTIEAVHAIAAQRVAEAGVARQATGRRVWMSWAAGLLVAAILVTGCGGGRTADPISSPITEEQALEMAEHALLGFNSGDYAAWTRDWSDTMKSAIDEGAFTSFRETYHDALGDYMALIEVSGAQGSDRGTYRWTYDIQFEKGAYRMWFGFKEGSRLIEGVAFEEPGA